MSPHRRVAITGLAPISAVGIGRDDFWQGLAEGREGRRPPERLQGVPAALPLLAECLDFVVEDYLESQKTYLDRCSQLVLAACGLAFEDAGLAWRDLDHPRVALSLGTAFGCLDSWTSVTARVQARGVRMASPVVFTHSFINTPASLAAIEYALQGPAATWCAGDLSAAVALQYALDLIRDGRADVALAGGADALSLPLLAAQGAEPLGDTRVSGEGACLLVLEPLDAATGRGARVLGELAEVDLAPPPAAAPPFIAPQTYGNTFGASLALDLAAALQPGTCDVETLSLTGRDASGRSAQVVVIPCR
jgi:3-oxoacyl-[acyl-carrier-protein] synthase II